MGDCKQRAKPALRPPKPYPGELPCKIEAAKWSVDFKTLGEGIWVTDSTPQGICNIVTVDKLDTGTFNGDWTLTVNTLAVGGTGGFCKDQRQAAGQTETFTGVAAQKFAELPCDFMSWVPGNSNFIHH